MKLRKLFIIISLICLMPFQNVKAQDFEITSDHVVLYNLNDDEIIYQNNSNESVPIASLTKIMTAIVSIEQVQDINQNVIVPENAFIGLEGYSIAGLRAGDAVTIKDLLYATLLPSGADAANSLAYIIGNNDYDQFISLMNQKAIELEMVHTHFDNVVGMDSDNNYSSASDLAKLLKYCLKNEIFKEIFTSRYYEITSTGLELESTLNGYTRYTEIDTSMIIGSKTGFTYGAGYCLASIAVIDDVNYLLIILGSDTEYSYNAIMDTITIYDYYSSNYGYHEIIKEGDIITTIPVKLGKIKEYDIRIPETRSQYLNNSFDIEDVELKYYGIEELNKKIKLNDRLGYVEVIYQGEILDNINIYLEDKIEYYQPLLYLLIGFILIFIILLIRYIIIKRIYLKKQTKLLKKRGY